MAPKPDGAAHVCGGQCWIRGALTVHNDPRDAEPADAGVGRSAAPMEVTAPRVRMRTGSLGIWFDEPLTGPLLLVPESHWDVDEPPPAPPTADTATPAPRPACTCGAGPGAGHQLRCAVYA